MIVFTNGCVVDYSTHEGPLSCWKRTIPVGLFHLLMP